MSVDNDWNHVGQMYWFFNAKILVFDEILGFDEWEKNGGSYISSRIV